MVRDFKGKTVNTKVHCRVLVCRCLHIVRSTLGDFGNFFVFG